MKSWLLYTLIGVGLLLLAACQITVRDETQHWGFALKISCEKEGHASFVRHFRVPDHKAYQHPVRLDDADWMRTLDYVKSGYACTIEGE